MVKSRSLAAKLVQAGRVRVNRDKAEQASQQVKPGDVLTVLLDRQVLVYRIVDCGARRGPASEARQLYEDLSPAPAPRDRSLPDEIVPLREIPAERTDQARAQVRRRRGLRPAEPPLPVAVKRST